MFVFAYLPILMYFLLEFTRKTPIKEDKQNRGSSILIGAVLTWMVIIPTVIYFFAAIHSELLLYIGVVVGAAGVWIRYSSIKTLGRFYSRNIGIQGEHTVVQSGWYRFIRHPGYLGTFLTYLGFAVSTSSWISVGVNIILFMIAYSYRIKVEEQALVSMFGEKYTEYQRRTWRMIPFLF